MKEVSSKPGLWELKGEVVAGGGGGGGSVVGVVAWRGEQAVTLTQGLA